jgi:hypothetical protein
MVLLLELCCFNAVSISPHQLATQPLFLTDGAANGNMTTMSYHQPL